MGDKPGFAGTPHTKIAMKSARMRRLTVLHVLNTFEDSSISRIVGRLIASIGTESIDWHVGAISPVGTMVDVFRTLGVPTAAFVNRGKAGENTIETLSRYVREHDIDIVHSHTPRATIWAALATRGCRLTRHLATRHSLYRLCEPRWGPLYMLLDRLSLYLPDQVVAVSQSMRLRIVAQPFSRVQHVTAIQNAIDCDEYYAPDQRSSCRRELGYLPDEIVLGYTGRIESGKRLGTLLRAFASILQCWPNVRLLVVGEGPRRRELSDLAAHLRIAHAVEWTGFRTDIARLLAAMDIYVQPSINEGLPLSILEAMAAQKPVVAVDIPGVREIIRNGQTGILVARSSPALLQTALTDLICQPGRQALIGEDARKHVCAKFALESMTTAYEHVYRALTAR